MTFWSKPFEPSLFQGFAWSCCAQQMDAHNPNHRVLGYYIIIFSNNYKYPLINILAAHILSICN